MKKTILYLHGKGGNACEVEQYAKNCPDFYLHGVDYQGSLPWLVQEQIVSDYRILRREYDSVILLANSIGAYFAMHALQNCDIQKALLISPILDMEQLILDMMGWAKVSEQELAQKGEIPTDFGETLSWKYLCFVREHPIDWKVPTEILYAEHDHLTSLQTVTRFAETHNAHLTILEGDAAGTGVRPVKAVCQSPRKPLSFPSDFRLHNPKFPCFFLFMQIFFGKEIGLLGTLVANTTVPPRH